jgi:hypothetical protein
MLKSAMRALQPTVAVVATGPASSPSWIRITPKGCCSRMQRRTMSV